jgi:imidazolonepropionase-like amidohydrolase
VAAHCHGTSGIRNATVAGVTTIEHCSWVGPAGWGVDYDEETARHIGERGIWVSPTINAGWKRNIGRSDFEARVRENYRRMRAAGVKLIASTDAGIPNVLHHHLPLALPVFAHFANLTPVEVLRSATSDCATAIGVGAETGRIAVGMSADLLLVEGDVLANLDTLAQPAQVWARGVAML